ncbi:hypothetical protein ACFE04_019148 [Oxalis oulophora]
MKTLCYRDSLETNTNKETINGIKPSFHVDTPLLLDPTDLLVGEDIFDDPIAATNLPLLINAHVTAASSTATTDSSDLTYRSRFLRLTRPLRSPRSPSSFQLDMRI